MSDSTDRTLTFAADIKPLFRESDRTAMLFAFDLWSADDVATHGTDIAERLEQGTMPCDGPWPADQVTRFRTWLDDGAQP